MPFDMFDKKFNTAATPMKATGEIQWNKEQVDLLCAYIVQIGDTGKITGGAYGVATKKPDRPDAFPIKNDGLIVNGLPQPTWKLTMRMVPGQNLQVGKLATGLALYRRNNGTLAVWLTPDIEIE